MSSTLEPSLVRPAPPSHRTRTYPGSVSMMIFLGGIVAIIEKLLSVLVMVMLLLLLLGVVKVEG
jgi:hypothetical protein